MYAWSIYIDWEDLLFFCHLLAEKDTGYRTCWDRVAQYRAGHSRTVQGRTGQDRAGQYRAELKLLQTYRTSGWASNMARINVVPDLGTPPMNINGISR